MKSVQRFAVLAAVVLTVSVLCTPVFAFDLSGLTRVVGGKTIGPDRFVIQAETELVNSYGVPYVMVEMGVGGTIEGYTALEGARYETFTDYPDMVLRGRGNYSPYYHGTAQYTPEDGTKLAILFPEDPEDWNGKVYAIGHGSPPYVQIGKVDPAGDNEKLSPGVGRNNFASLMIDKGYAVSFSSRSSSSDTGIGPSTVTLDDGTVLNSKAFGMHAGLFIDLTNVGNKYIEHRMGSEVQRTYFYGKSQAANLGKVLNYIAGANRDYKDPSKKVFDGFLHNDPGGGLFLPILMIDGEDVLLRTEEDKADFVPMIDISKSYYVGEQFIENTYWGTYWEVKRENQRLLNNKGLGHLSRTYELVGTSHTDTPADYLPTTDSLNMNPEIGGVIDAAIDLLERWVEDGVAPPPTRSNSYDLSDVDGDRILDYPAIELPEIAAPTGLYYRYPEGRDGSGNLGFVAFTKVDYPIWNGTAANTQKGIQTKPADFDVAWLEPMDHYGGYVDMNGNGARDTRESITKAWRRRRDAGYKYGILGHDEVITHEKYVSEIARVAGNLYAEGFLSGRGMRSYIEAAINSDVGK